MSMTETATSPTGTAATCIAVDSACDLPRSFIDANNIQILPITLKLGANTFLVSYAGDPKHIEECPEHQAFIAKAKQQGTTTMVSVRSTTAAINVGPGAFCLAFAAK